MWRLQRGNTMKRAAITIAAFATFAGLPLAYLATLLGVISW